MFIVHSLVFIVHSLLFLVHKSYFTVYDLGWFIVHCSVADPVPFLPDQIGVQYD